MPPDGAQVPGTSPPDSAGPGSPAPLDYQSRRAARSAPLAQRAARGFAWLMLQTVGGKAVNMVGEIVLAWLLLKSDYGLRGLAMTVFTLANILQEAGINQILVHRQAKFARWANAAFWCSIALGLAGGLVMAGLAPFAAKLFLQNKVHATDPAAVRTLTGMILLLALRSPINAVATVPNTQLQIELKFRLQAIIGFAMVVLTAGLSVLFARLGFGAYSFVLPLLLAAVARAAVLWIVARPPVRLKPQIRRWRYLIGQSGVLYLCSLFFAATTQGDYITLGVMYSAGVLGIYFFAYNLCLQTTQFFTVNLTAVLFPTFSKLQREPQRLLVGFLRATKMLALLGLPVCLLQAALAGPMVQVLFRVHGDPQKWVPAVPVLQVISVAMGLQLFNMPALSLIQAQGRFRTMLGLSVVCAGSFLALVVAAALCGHPPDGALRWAWLARGVHAVFAPDANVTLVVAFAVMVYCAIIGPCCLYVAIRPISGKWGDIWPIYGLPLAISSAAVGIGLLAGHPLPHSWLGNWLKLLVVAPVTLLAYVPLVRWTARDAWDDLLQRLRGLLNRAGA